MSFALDLKKFAEKAGANADLVVRKVTFEVANSLVMRSPVDTGRFRANWQFDTSGLPSGTLGDTDKDGSATMARLSAAIMQSQAGGITYLANNLPYAQRLEYGWSKRSPNGMVRVTLAEFESYIRKAVGDLGK